MKDRFVFPAWIKPASDWQPGETGFVVGFRDLPECHSQGGTEAEALTNAADCLEEAVAGRLLDGADIPVPSAAESGEHPIPVPPQTAAKAALGLAVREANMTKADLARRLGCDEKDVRRLLDPRHGSRLPALATALTALGKRLVVDVQNAA